MSLKTVKIFQYLDDLDCFVVSDAYRGIADQLGLTEWSPVVWIGRLFTLDNAYGEHWFDNWHLREQLELEAAQRGLSDEVLRSLELSYDLLADEARAFNQERLRYLPDEYIPDLEGRIAALERELFGE
jgi:hypothetical protein